MPIRKVRSIPAPAAVLPLCIYRTIVDTIPHMLWAAQPDGTVDYFNAWIVEYTGLAAEQLSGWGWTSVLHADDLGRCVARWKRALATGRGFEAEYRLRRADGAFRWHVHSVLALRENGRVAMWYGTCTDIHERRNAVRLLEQARQTLESLVTARTRDLDSGGDHAIERLSERELQVLQLIVEGRTSAQVGERLGLSPKSVDTYRSRLMAKLGLRDLPALVKFAIRHGLTTIG